MRTAGIAELRAKLSEHIALVKRGEEILVTERGRPVARIVPVAPAETDEEARMQRLAARGLIKLGRKRSPEEAAELLASVPVRGVPRGALLRALLEDRKEGG